MVRKVATGRVNDDGFMNPHSNNSKHYRDRYQVDRETLTKGHSRSLI